MSISLCKYSAMLLALIIACLCGTYLPASADNGPPAPPPLVRPVPILMETTSDDVYDVVHNANQPVFVYYYKDTDPRAYDQELIIQQAAREWSGYILFYKVNVTVDPDPGSLVYKPPTMLLYSVIADGQIQMTTCLSGYQDFAAIRDFIATGLSNGSQAQLQPRGATHMSLPAARLYLSAKSRTPVMAMVYHPGSLLSEAEVTVFRRAAANWGTRMDFIIVEDPDAEKAPMLRVYYAANKHFYDIADRTRLGFLDGLQLDQFIAESLKPPSARSR